MRKCLTILPAILVFLGSYAFLEERAARAGSSNAGAAHVTSSGAAVPKHVDAAGGRQIGYGNLPTYGVCVGTAPAGAVTAAANPTDAIVLTGSDTKVIHVSALNVELAQTTAATGSFSGGPNFVLVKRTSLDSGGTKTLVTPVAFDSADSPATATVSYYTANPSSLGTQSVVTCNAWTAIPVLTGAPSLFTLTTGLPTQGPLSGYCEGLTLQGANESLVVNFTGADHTGLQFAFAISWTETSGE